MSELLNLLAIARYSASYFLSVSADGTSTAASLVYYS